MHFKNTQIVGFFVLLFIVYIYIYFFFAVMTNKLLDLRQLNLSLNDQGNHLVNSYLQLVRSFNNTLLRPHQFDV